MNAADLTDHERRLIVDALRHYRSHLLGYVYQEALDAHNDYEADLAARRELEAERLQTRLAGALEPADDDTPWMHRPWLSDGAK